MAMEAMVVSRNELFKRLLTPAKSTKDAEVFDWQKEIEEIKEQLLKDFGEAVSEPEELARVQEALGKLAENTMKAMIESDEVTSIDIREARLMQAQIAIQKQMAQKETYSVPVLVGDEITNVTLKIVRGVEKRGVVDIMLESKFAGKIAATFQALEKGISGVIATDNRETQESMTASLGNIINALSEEDAKVKVAYIKDLDLTHFTNALVTSENQDSAIDQVDEAVYEVQTTRLYRIAESFIKVVRENYK